MTHDPLVSVIIPTYNRQAVLPRAIESVLAQTYKNTEIVVVDDGSTDGTQQTLERFCGRIQIARQNNSGPSIARNRGISLAQGSIIAFLDSDDYWLPTKLTRQVELLERVGNIAPCCLCNSTVIYRDGTKASTFAIADVVSSYEMGLWLNPAEILSSRFVMFTQAAAVRREALDRAGHFPGDLRFYEDYELPLRLSLLGPWAIIQDELVVYHDGSSGSWAELGLRESVRLHEDLVAMRERVLNLLTGPQNQVARRVLQRELSRSRRALFLARLGQQKFTGAASLAKELRRMEWLRRALFRRSPGFPRMRVEPVN